MMIEYGDSPLFTFALIADSHMNPGDQNSSPFETNAMANARSRYVIEEVNKVNPDFVIHLGDLVHPVPGHPNFSEVAGDFKRLFKRIEAPLYIIPGNHDCGDKKISWMPAVQVNDEFLQTYQECFGPHYSSFNHKGVHFVLINSPVLNSGLDLEIEQQIWLERDLAQNNCDRTFLFTHYPPYITQPNEDTNYDNIDEPARSWLLGLIEKYEIEGVFAGHVHNFFYNRLGASEHYVLPSVAFVRHDYSEFNRIAPKLGSDGGRNDLPKLGYFLVEVYGNGHIAHNVRSYGGTLEAGSLVQEKLPCLPAVHSRDNSSASVGVHLRHAWNEITTIPHNYAMDEFMRKKIRNDYPLMALWEMGVKKLRVPVGDFMEIHTLKRIRDLRKIGHEFTVFSYGSPNSEQMGVLRGCEDAFDNIEFIMPEGEIESSLESICAIKNFTKKPVYLSALHSLADSAEEGGQFKHLISSGFSIEEREKVASFISSLGLNGVVDGLVFRIDQSNSCIENIRLVQEWLEQQDTRAIIHVRFASDDMTGGQMNDLITANRVAEATIGALSADRLLVFLDTFVDQDRGYFIRSGLIDRAFNPRLGAKIVRHLHSVPKVIGGQIKIQDIISIADGQMLVLQGLSSHLKLYVFLPESQGIDVARALASRLSEGCAGAGNWINLETGEITSCEWKKEGNIVMLEQELNCLEPSMIIAHR